MKIHNTSSHRTVNAQGCSPELPKGVVLEDDLEFDEDIEIGPDAEFGPPLHFTVPEDPGDD
jgi:hypothetical protein